ncbi:hypothetical protein K8I28_12910 [bacterium]|nr:hypothetical protein [bacterium]
MSKFFNSILLILLLVVGCSEENSVTEPEKEMIDTLSIQDGLKLYPDSIGFGYLESQRSLYIENPTDEPFTITAHEDIEWLTISPDSVIVESGERASISLVADRRKLTAGIYVGILDVLDENGIIATLKVSITETDNEESLVFQLSHATIRYGEYIASPVFTVSAYDLLTYWIAYYRTQPGVYPKLLMLPETEFQRFQNDENYSRYLNLGSSQNDLGSIYVSYGIKDGQEYRIVLDYTDSQGSVKQIDLQDELEVSVEVHRF